MRSHTISLIVVISIVILISGCKDSVSTLSPETSPAWKVVPDLARVDVRYIIEHDSELYLAAVDPTVLSVCDSTGCHYLGERSMLYKTSDAITWTKIKGFTTDIGPLTYHGDTLYCLANDSIYRMYPDGAWESAFPTPPRLGDASADGDMTFIKDTLYAMQTFYGNAVETYRIHPDGAYDEVPGPDGIIHYAGAKYIKNVVAGEERTYLRPHWLVGGFFRFDGYQYVHMEQGLIQTVLGSSPSDAMATSGDTLFAGFGGTQGSTPGVIMRLESNQWLHVHDTIPSSHSAYLVSPTLYAQPTAIALAAGRMFVATNSQGVLEWDDVRGWVRMSDGLKPGHIPGLNEPDLKYPVPFLKYIKGVLVAAYGSPGYGPWGEVGVYTWTVK